MKNLKRGDKVIYIGKNGHFFTKWGTYKVIETVDDRYRNYDSTKEDEISITDNMWEDGYPVHTKHCISESFFKLNFKVKGEVALFRIKKGDEFRYIGKGGYFTNGKTYKVEIDMYHCEVLENVRDVIAFIDDEGATHFATKDFLNENFCRVYHTEIKEDLQHEVICKGLAIKWGKRLNTGIMGEGECKDFISECKYFSVEVEDVLNEVEDMEEYFN